MLDATSVSGDESGYAVLMAGAIAVAALVVLAGCLSSHAKTGGDL